MSQLNALGSRINSARIGASGASRKILMRAGCVCEARTSATRMAGNVRKTFSGVTIGAALLTIRVRARRNVAAHGVGSVALSASVGTRVQVHVLAPCVAGVEAVAQLRAYVHVPVVLRGQASAALSAAFRTYRPSRSAVSCQVAAVLSAKLRTSRAVRAPVAALAVGDCTLGTRKLMHVPAPSAATSVQWAHLRRLTHIALSVDVGQAYSSIQMRRMTRFECSTRASAVGDLTIRKTNSDYAPEDRTFDVPQIDRVFYVTGD